MRPHQLIMKAFGPFKEETVVDFDAMGNSIYLISGDTGAGKTTIFDGIIYALYGTASGGGRSNLSTEAFHSDYAKHGNQRDEMSVDFIFSNAGRTFTVSRRMFWGKKGISQKANKEATLSENGNTIVYAKGREDKDDVTARITEILGLDADQFRRIIMLAQGEFKKFLEAGSDKRGEILGKLYDNRKHRDFQYRLKAVSTLLSGKESECLENKKTQLEFFSFPDNISDEDRAAISINHPQLLTTMKELIDDIKTSLADTDAELKKLTEAMVSLTAKKTKAETQNKLFDDLKNHNKQLSEMDAEREEIERLREHLSDAVSAEKVLPDESVMKSAEESWNNILERIKELEEERRQLKNREAELRKTMEDIESRNIPKMEALSKEITNIKGILRFYDELSESMKVYEEKKTLLELAEENTKSSQSTFDQKNKRQQELKDELEKLENSGEAAVSNAKYNYDQQFEYKNKLELLRSDIKSWFVLYEKQKKLTKDLNRAREKSLKAEEEHLRLNRLFIQGQAGLIAQEMIESLSKEDETVCPVCGAVHTADDIGEFAKLHTDVPSRETVANALEDWNTARDKESEIDSKHSSKEAEIKTKKTIILEASKELMDIDDWEKLIDGNTIEIVIKESEKKLSSLKDLHEKAVNDYNSKQKALEEKQQIDIDLLSAKKSLEEMQQKENDIRSEAAAAKVSVTTWESQLKGYPKLKTDAENKIQKIESDISTLQSQIDIAKEDHNKCLHEISKNEGNRNSAADDKLSRKKAKDKAEEKFAASLKRHNFNTVELYRKALSPDGKELDPDGIASWISQTREKVSDYDQKYQEHKVAVKQLIKSTEGMQRIDIQELSDQISVMDEEIKKLESYSRKLENKYEIDKKVYKKVSSIQEQLRTLSMVYEKIKPLSEVANGNYPFSRYVLTDFFHRIIEQANVHLETMTDGEYCLIPVEFGDGRKNIGLGLKVMNTITGIERDTASLSGGQSFEASLSLALGLSDIVQMESTSQIQIDSMFIDEGFGSLDANKLNRAINVLQHLSADKRQIGIISHVARLDECIPRKIHVISGDSGSSIQIETDV